MAPGFDMGSPHIPNQLLRGFGMCPGLGFPVPYTQPRHLEPTRPPRSLETSKVPCGCSYKSQLLSGLTCFFWMHWNERGCLLLSFPHKAANDGSSGHELCIIRCVPPLINGEAHYRQAHYRHCLS